MSKRGSRIWRKNVSRGVRSANLRPEVERKRRKVGLSNSRRLKNLWKDKVYREKHLSFLYDALEKGWWSRKFRRKRRKSREKMWRSPSYRRKVCKSFSVGACKKWKKPELREALEKQLADARSRSVSPSKPQISLFKRICRAGYKGFCLEERVSRFSLDIAHRRRKFGVEVDCRYWHNKRHDGRRDKLLRKLGWEIVRVRTSEVHTIDLKRLIPWTK